MQQIPAHFPQVTFKLLNKKVNEGKGAALRDAWSMATGDLQMMPRDRFMQRKRYHFPLGPGLRFIKIDKVGTGTGPVGGAGTVIRCGGVRGGDGRDSFHAIGLARQGPEDFYQVWVHGLG